MGIEFKHVKVQGAFNRWRCGRFREASPFRALVVRYRADHEVTIEPRQFLAMRSANLKSAVLPKRG